MEDDEADETPADTWRFAVLKVNKLVDASAAGHTVFVENNT